MPLLVVTARFCCGDTGHAPPAGIAGSTRGRDVSVDQSTFGMLGEGEGVGTANGEAATPVNTPGTHGPWGKNSTSPPRIIGRPVTLKPSSPDIFDQSHANFPS